MTRLWLIRHGPTHASGMIGWTDLPADLTDVAALDRLAAVLPLAPAVSSDLSRAVATADAVMRGRPRLPHDPGLREMHFGAWETRRHADVEAEDPALIRRFRDHPGRVAPPGGESWDALSGRVAAAIDGHLTDAGPDLIVVAHFGVILSLLQRALRVPARDVFAHRIDPLSLTVIDTPGWSVDRINQLP